MVCALDILNALDKAPFTRKEIIEWVYKFQVPVLPGDTTHANCYGFRGGLHLPFTKDGSTELNHNDMAHIANTYCALAVLTICGDDLSRVNKKAIATALKSYQNPATGSFQCLPCEIGQAETDVRFVYCACCISVLLNDWSGVDTEKAIGYLLSCQHFDGGFGWEAGTESHSGLTYCVVAALKMMNGLKQVRDYEGLVRYLSARCGEEGWNGRIGKIPDSCYTFWNIASLASLGRLLQRDG